MSDLEHAGVLLPHEQSTYDEVYEWFRKNLKKPRSLARSSKPHAKNVALSWFKDSAKEHLARMHALAQILEAHGVMVETIRTTPSGTWSTKISSRLPRSRSKTPVRRDSNDIVA